MSVTPWLSTLAMARALIGSPGSEFLILTCIRHVRQNKPVFRTFTRINKQNQLNEGIIIDNASDNDCFIIQSSCLKELLTIRKS